MTSSDGTKARFPEVSKAPFVLPAGASPGVVAEQIVACFRVVGELDRPATDVFEAVRASLGLDPLNPLVTAGARIASEIDRGVAGQARNAYHNSQHICEVVLCSLFLGQQAGLSGERLVRVVIAALVHDFRHDGTTNAGESFRLERLALAAAGPYLAQAGVAPEQIERIAAIVLATEVRAGVPYARCCFRFLHHAGPPPEAPPDGAGEASLLRRLATEPDLAVEAVLLAEADLLPSVALTEDYGMLCQQRLIQENGGIGVGPAEKLAFLDEQSEGFLVSGFFEPNFNRLRRSIVAVLSGRMRERATMNQETRDILLGIPLFAELGIDRIGDLIDQAALRTYRANTVVMQKGDEASALYVLLSGRVKVFSADDNGKEIVLNELGPGDYLGELALIEDSTRSASVMTVTPSRFLVIPKASFQAYLISRPGVALHLIGALAARVRKLTEEVERLALRDVYSRLADTLQARAVEENGRLITDALTQRDLAALVGASREMISRILKDLKAGGYIALEGKRVVIHRKLPERW
ncbi:cyclic nucleotide-binding domain-containing protein [Thiocapsa sp.]|uniref:cyclic nucleotide-binding domain-containing protein n=1 Tax=Thiocapsa sp. TaxID=2024551 RepID=UPI0025F49E22|nr:cyclic nucleotide-binding domain-containing protein [Thiocapsa sp.]